jgi:Na+-translocating ferredoxin:NAD+ oxidoreductase subunit G
MRKPMPLFAHILLTLSLIGVISGGVLAQVNAWAVPQIAENQRLATERAIYHVQPEAERYELLESDALTVYRVYGAGDRPVGYALVHSGQGFQDAITLVIGVEDDRATITGIEVLEQSETPGLGTVITESDFLSQFLGLVGHPQIEWVKTPPQAGANEVEMVTGATISTRAVVVIVNDAVAKLQQIDGGTP